MFEESLNAVVCKECKIVIPLNWHESHLKERHLKERHNHGDDTTLEEYLKHFDHATTDELPHIIPELLDTLGPPVDKRLCMTCHMFTHQTGDKCRKRPDASRCKGELVDVKAQATYDQNFVSVIKNLEEEDAFEEEDEIDRLFELAKLPNEWEKRNQNIPYCHGDFPRWLKIMCWSPHFKRLRFPKVRDKWMLFSNEEATVKAHIELMKLVYAYNMTPESKGARYAAAHRSQTRHVEEPIQVPAREHQRHNLAAFLFMFKFVMSRPGMFLFTPFQRQCYDILHQDTSPLTVGTFWLSLLCHPISGVYTYHPLVAGLAALNYNPRRGWFVDAQTAMANVNMIILNCKLLLIYMSAKHGLGSSHPALSFANFYLPFAQRSPLVDYSTFIDSTMRKLAEMSTCRYA